MNSHFLSALAALVLTATLTADDAKPPAFLKPGKEYSFQLLDNAKLPEFSGSRVTIPTAPQAGWVRIEYFRAIGWAAGSPPPKDMSPKHQIWLNLNQVISIEEVKPATSKETKAER